MFSYVELRRVILGQLHVHHPNVNDVIAGVFGLLRVHDLSVFDRHLPHSIRLQHLQLELPRHGDDINDRKRP